MNLKIFNDIFSIHRLPSNSEYLKEVFQSDFFSVSKTEDELSIVCNQSIKIEDSKVDDGWSCIKVIGPLDFSLVGILAKISTILSEANISIFVISTFDTDYILVKKENIENAKTELENEGYTFV